MVGATGGGNDEVFFESDKRNNKLYDNTGKNAHTVSPINKGVTVTVPSGVYLLFFNYGFKH